MASDLTPNEWIASWSEDATNITFPIASIPGLTAAEADGDTGDIRKVLFPLLETLYQEWLATATADRPTQMTITKSASLNIANTQITHVFSFRFLTEIESQEVVDEPA